MPGRVLGVFLGVLGGIEVFKYHKMQWKILNTCAYLCRNHYKLDYFSVHSLYITEKLWSITFDFETQLIKSKDKEMVIKIRMVSRIEQANENLG